MNGPSFNDKLLQAMAERELFLRTKAKPLKKPASRGPMNPIEPNVIPTPAPRRWLKMGIELEGAWIKRPHDIIRDKGILKAQAKRDGSVRVRSDWEETEIITRPHDNMDELIADVLALYPDRVDDSCGLHIHASFDPLDTSALADPAFHKHYKARWEAWGNKHNPGPAFWERYHGRTPGRGGGDRQYCRDIFKPEEQLTDHADRYTQINFTAYHKFKTIECRMLPMFEATEAGKVLVVSAIRELADIYNSYLAEFGFPRIEMERLVEITPDGVTEHYPSVMPDMSYQEQTLEMTTKRLATGPDVHYHYEAPGADELMAPFGQVRDNTP